MNTVQAKKALKIVLENNFMKKLKVICIIPARGVSRV